MTKTTRRGPKDYSKCPFYITPDDPLSAMPSVQRCAQCVIANNPQLASHRDDLQQIALLTILETAPKYDASHPSGASFITYIKAKVCNSLWAYRATELKYLPFALEEEPVEEQPPNLLVSRLIAEACTQEKMEDVVIQQMAVEAFRKQLPDILANLSEKERRVLVLKFFQERTGVEIAKELSISAGRVSQLTKAALAKVKKAYLNGVEKSTVVGVNFRK